ncbi:VOC family protein [Halostella litorea]|uniref:VOC family protein n=1 Tax=Halostella litorea TaxID=2528831 RepID=UPI0010932ECE|nr:VOC family protein [Halostella litorea]
MSEPRPDRVGHVHLKVRDVERALSFYTDALGLDVEERYDRFAFLSWGERHHDVALQAVGEDAPAPGPGVGLYHAAFEVPTPAALRATYERLRERGVDVSPVDHGISKAIYFDDPDGNGLEVYLDTRGEGGDEWDGHNRRFDPTSL